MAQKGANYPALTANFNDGGNVAWATPTAAEVDDGATADAAMTVGQTSRRLRCTNFGLGIPAAATILGVKVEVKWSGSRAGIAESSVQLIILSVEAGNNLATGADLGAMGYKVYGGPTELWGLALTPSNLNNSANGCSLKAQNSGSGAGSASIDTARMTVYYDVEGSATRSQTITITSAGVRRRVGAGARAQVIAIVSAGVRRLVGVAARSETLTFVSAGVRRLVGVAARSETLTFVTAGVRRLVGSGARAQVIAIAAAGVRRLVGVAARSETLTFVAAGVRRLVGAATLPETFTVAVAGVRRRVGAVTVPETFTVAVAGALRAAGAATRPETLTITAAGVRRRVGAATRPETIDFRAAGVRVVVGSAALACDLDIGPAAGARIAVDAADLTINITIQAEPHRTTYAAAHMATELRTAVAGVRRLTSSATLPIAFTYVTLGVRRHVGGGSLPLELDIQAAGEVTKIIHGVPGSARLAAGAQPRLAKQAAGEIDRSVAGQVEGR